MMRKKSSFSLMGIALVMRSSQSNLRPSDNFLYGLESRPSDGIGDTRPANHPPKGHFCCPRRIERATERYLHVARGSTKYTALGSRQRGRSRIRPVGAQPYGGKGTRYSSRGPSQRVVSRIRPVGAQRYGGKGTGYTSRGPSQRGEH